MSVKTLSPRDLARAVGVSESSVKRWADDGRLPFVRTAGGHRRIPVAAAVKFVRDAGLDVERPDLLGLRGLRVAARGTEPEAAALEEALRCGDDDGARRIVVASFLQGVPVAALCDGPIRLALGALGELWREGPEGITIEHHAVDACMQALMEIRSLLTVADDAPLAVGGALEFDPYLLPSLMASAILAEAGFRTVNLGANAPAKAVRSAIETQRPQVVWRSVSVSVGPSALRRDLEELTTNASHRFEVLVGGRGVVPGIAPGMERVHVLDSMTAMSGFARALLRSNVGEDRSGRD